MATRTRNRRRRRTHNRARGRYTRRRNTGRRYNTRRRRARNPKVIVRYRNRRRRRNYGRRRNQGVGAGFLAGDSGKVVGALGGAAVTSILTGFVPATWKTGFMGYLTTGVIAVIQGNLIGRAMKNKSLGNWMTVGGLLIVGLQLMQNFFPGLNLGLTTTGMGLITSSNFFVPQVNNPGSMASFVQPAAIPQVVSVPATGMNGLGAQPITGLRSLRRIGRFR